MTTEQAHAVATRYLEAWNAGDLDAFAEIVAPDYVNRAPGLPDPAPGPAGLVPIVAHMRTAVPDLRYDPVHVVAEGDLVAIHSIVSGTWTGPLFGAPATGRPFRAAQMQVERIRDGRIVEHWRVTDARAMAGGSSAG